jgi:ABC-2 type transport system permease protein
MITQIRAELLKIRTTRTTIALLLGMMALILLFTLLTGLLSDPSGLMGKENQRELLGVSSLTGVFSALAGVLLVTGEYRFGTIRPTFLFNPARSHVLAAKVLAGALAGIAFGVIGEAIAWAVAYAVLDGRGITVMLSSGDILLLTLGGLAGAALWGRDRRGPRSDHPQPGRRRHRAARLGLLPRHPAVRPRPLGGAVHAGPCLGRTDGPP